MSSQNAPQLHNAYLAITRPDPSPEHRLWAAVLANACRDLVNPVNPGPSQYRVQYRREAKQKALDWFRSENLHIGSYLWVCAVLDIHPQPLRTAVMGGKIDKRTLYHMHMHDVYQ